MPNEANPSEHRAIGWAAIGQTLAAIGATSGVALAIWGGSSHQWGDDYFLAGFATACTFTALGVYVLVAEFIGGIGPLRFPLPLTRHERLSSEPLPWPNQVLSEVGQRMAEWSHDLTLRRLDESNRRITDRAASTTSPHLQEPAKAGEESTHSEPPL